MGERGKGGREWWLKVVEGGIVRRRAALLSGRARREGIHIKKGCVRPPRLCARVNQRQYVQAGVARKEHGSGHAVIAS